MLKHFFISLVICTTSVSYAEAWNIKKDLKSPGRIIKNGERELKNAVKTVVPNNISCAQWTAHPYYMQTVSAIRSNKDALSRNGINDRSTCQSNSRTVASIISTNNRALGIVSNDLGRCACINAY